jgi:hypothetical protein
MQTTGDKIAWQITKTKTQNQKQRECLLHIKTIGHLDLQGPEKFADSAFADSDLNTKQNEIQRK